MLFWNKLCVMITVLVWSVQYFQKNDESYLKELCHEIYHEIQTVRADNKLSNLNMYVTSQQIQKKARTDKLEQD